MKHERNFMAELLDEFLASLETFGDRQLSVEDPSLAQFSQLLEFFIALANPTNQRISLLFL